MVSNTNQLKMLAKDGKMVKTDVLDTKGILRLIESVPSPKAEPFKMWLARLGGNTAKIARDDLERKLGESVVSSNNSLGYQYKDDNNMIANK